MAPELNRQNLFVIFNDFVAITSRILDLPSRNMILLKFRIANNNHECFILKEFWLVGYAIFLIEIK